MLPPDSDAPAPARPAARREDERLIVRVGPERFALPLIFLQAARKLKPGEASPVIE